MEALLTPEEVARRLRISRRTVLGRLQAGWLGGVVIGRPGRPDSTRPATCPGNHMNPGSYAAIHAVLCGGGGAPLQGASDIIHS